MADTPLKNEAEWEACSICGAPIEADSDTGVCDTDECERLAAEDDAAEALFEAQRERRLFGEEGW